MPKKKTKEDFIQDAIRVHDDRYDYSKVKYINSSTKVIIICKEHGEFEQKPNKHLSQKHGCPKCGGSFPLNNITYIEEAKRVHDNKYDYSKVKYINSSTKVIIICKEHGEFEQVSNSHLQGKGCKKCQYVKNSNNKRYYTDFFIKKANEIHDDIYDYSNVKYITSLVKIIIICKEHGEFEQKPSGHLQGQGCIKCSGKYQCTSDEWVEKAKEVHGNKYDYSKVKYINSSTKVIIICKEHGEFEQNPRSTLKGFLGCQKCNLCPSCQLWRTLGKLCIYCKPNNKLYKKAYEKSKEYAVLKYLREKLPDYDFIHNKSVGSLCTKDDKENSNGHLFPDIRIDCGFYHLIVEVDENKHRGADYKCDKQRMYDIIAKLGVPCIFIRYNPDSKESNREILLKQVHEYLELDIEDDSIWDDFGFKVDYMFY